MPKPRRMAINFLAILPVPMIPAVLPYMSNPKKAVQGEVAVACAPGGTGVSSG